MIKPLRKLFVHAAKPAGESLMEVIIAVGILMLIIGPAAGLYISSNRKTHLSEKLLIANQLAQDGVELVTSVEESNRTRFSSRESECWLAPVTQIDLATCQLNPLTAGSYQAENTVSGITLTRVGGAETLSANLDAQSDAPYELKKNPMGLYTINEGAPTGFYREINLTTTDLDNADGDNSNNTGADALEINSVVRFHNGSEINQGAASKIIFKP